MFDIITFGSATKDIFLKTNKFKFLKSNEFISGEGVCLNLGSKVDIDEILFSSGGGGTNTAATFAKQGFKVAYCGVVGDDLAGQELINELKSLKIDTRLVAKTKTKATNHSIVFLHSGEDRTILVYRGASEMLGKAGIPWKKLKTKWIYLAPLSGELCSIFEDIIDFAYENKIKIVVNPGNCQLSYPAEKLARILKKVDVLILNQEEASLLTKIPFQEETEIFKKIDEICPGIAVLTKGGEGVVVSDGTHLYSAKPDASRKIKDTTGAGDSFASGFISSYMRNPKSIESAIQLGMGNSASCLGDVGAKTGLLKKREEFVKVMVAKEECLQNGLCQCKECS